VITSISYDHTQVLGNTLTAIATEKCGIIKPSLPVVSAPQDPEAMAVIERIARERNAPLSVVGRDLLARPVRRSLNHQVVELRLPSGKDLSIMDDSIQKLEVVLPLLGDHQVENAAVAYLAIDRFRQNALPVSDDQIRDGFSKTYWPGRFEILNQNPPLILDCAHNLESCHQLMLTIQTMFPGYKILLIFGASEDKDIDGMFRELLPSVEQAIFTKSYHPRAISPVLLEQKVKSANIPTQVIETVADALQQALAMVNEQQVILVTGSIFVVAEARHAWLADPRFKSFLHESLK